MSMRFGVLGPVEAASDLGPVALKGSRQRAVLARLLLARGRVVPVDRLVDDLWEAPAGGAVAAIRTFVADLRRALEPDRPPRRPARLLVTAPPGYALRAAPDAVDAWRFEAAVGESGPLLAAGQAGPALAGLEQALGLWRGPAYAEFAGDGWARAEIDRLDELRLLGVERRAEALLALGRTEEVAFDLQGHVDGHPLREDAWHLLATALYRSGRQGDALAALRRARETLAAELGVDPGPRLRRLEADILAQAPRLSRPETSPVLFVDREDELARLEHATGLALVSGEAGAGKTALVDAFARRLAVRGWSAEWVRVPEADGAAVAWPWGGPRRPDAIAHLAAVAARGPVLLVVDDLHRADEGTLDLVAGLVGGPAVVLGTYRATDITPALAAALARFARSEPVRVYLGGLSERATGELAGAVAGQALDAATVRLVHRRSGGNPFFVRELARLLATEGSAALAQVPAGVRDVIRHRLAALPEAARAVLRQASVIGRDLDPDVLAEVVGDGLLDALDRALEAGFLTDDRRLRFTHVLVRDTLYGDLSAPRRAAWHAEVAEAIERVAPADVAALAHHFARAGSRAAASQAAHYARVAAVQAERRSDPHEAARLWRQVLDVRGPGDGHAAMGLGRALAVTGHLAEARRLRAEAVAAAERLGDPEQTASVIAAFDVPAVWARNDDEKLSRQIVEAAERTLGALPAGRAVQRSRLLSTIALELRGTTADRGHRAACEAEALARGTGDPAVLAFALNARFMHSFRRAGMASVRIGIGEELLALASLHGLVTFEVLARLILLQAHCALASFDAADAHARAASALASRYGLPLVGVFVQWYEALRSAVDGSASAVAAYRAADARLAGDGMPGMSAGLLSFALVSLGVAGPLSGTVLSGPDEAWGRPLALLAGGRADLAAAALRALPDSPRDHLLEARLCLVTRAALAVGDREMMARVYAELSPADGELAGAGSGVLTFGPVRRYLDELSSRLSDPAPGEPAFVGPPRQDGRHG